MTTDEQRPYGADAATPRWRPTSLRESAAEAGSAAPSVDDDPAGDLVMGLDAAAGGPSPHPEDPAPDPTDADDHGNYGDDRAGSARGRAADRGLGGRPRTVEPLPGVPVPTLDAFPPPAPPRPTATSARRRERRHASTQLFAVTVLVSMSVLMFVLLRPDLIFNTATPTGGDNSVHIWTADYVKRVLLPHGRLSGWSNDSFAGMPVLTFYFPLPSWLIVFLSFVIPYAIAFKLVTVLGILTLPWACFRLGKRAGLAWPEPLFLAAGAFPFLLSRHYRILGGNIFSTMAGEFSFSLSLVLTVVYMGSLVRLLRTGTGRTRTTAVLAAVGLCHIVPSIFAVMFTVAAFACELTTSRWKRQVRDLASVGVVALLLTAFWTVPFAYNLPYTNSMDYERNTRTLRTLFPLLPHSATLHTPADGTAVASIFCVLMIVALVVGIRRGDRFIGALGLSALASGVAFAVWPRSAMWNNRLLPSWFFCVYTLGGIGAWHTAVWLVRLVRRRKTAEPEPEPAAATDDPTAPTMPATPVAPVIAPAGSGRTPLVGPVLLSSAMILSVLGPAFVSKNAHLPFAWAAGNFTGTEGRKAWPEYRNLINVLETLPCGRMYSESDGKLYDKYGSTLSMMAMPYWTKDCIQTIDGLYFEASQTTPFHYLTASMMSPKAGHSQRRLPYGSYDMTTGVDRLRKLGVRYVLLGSDSAKGDAHRQPALRLVASSGPYEIFEIRDSAVVTGLAAEPVVVTGVDARELGAFTDVGIAQWVRPQTFPSTVAIDGPPYWKRVALVRGSTATTPTPSPSTPATNANGSPRTKITLAIPSTSVPTAPAAKRRGDGLSMPVAQETLTPAVVSNTVIGNQKISFSVDRPGTPVLVRVSWFPNWKAHGAAGPYRVAPNFMVVVPTRKDVTLTYEYTRIDLGAIAVSIAGLLILLASAVRALRRRRAAAAPTPAG